MEGGEKELIDVSKFKQLCSEGKKEYFSDGSLMVKEDTIDVEAVIASMVAGAAILAEYIMDFEKNQKSRDNKRYGLLDMVKDLKYFHGADDSWFDYMPNGLEVVSKVIDLWNELVDTDTGDGNWEIPKLFEGEFWLQDCVPSEAWDTIKEILTRAGHTFDEDD
jgi:hypothetical protein